MKMYRYLLPFLWKDAAALLRTAVTLGLLLVGTALATSIPLMQKWIVDEGLTRSSVALLAGAVFLYGLFWGIRYALPHLYQILFFPVVNEAIRTLHARVVVHQLHGNEDSPTTGEILSAIKRISLSLRLFFKYVVVDALPTLLSAIAAIVTVALVVSKSIGCGILVMILGYLLLSYVGVRRNFLFRKEAWEKTDASTRVITELLAQKREIRSGSLAQPSQRLVDGFLADEAVAWLDHERQYQGLFLVQYLFFGLSLGVVMVLATYWVQVGLWTVGDWVLVHGYLIGLIKPLQATTSHLRHLLETSVDLKAIRPWLSPIQELTTCERAPLADGIIIDKIAFSYERETVFDDFSLTIPVGQRAAVIGAMGCGKSTLARLVAGAMQPQKGSVVVMGHDPYPGDPFFVHLVGQKPFLLEASLEENLLFGTKNVTKKRLHIALEKTGLDGLVRQLPGGLSTSIGEWGELFSSGQRQLIALTRACLIDPKVLILDEATCHLDARQEAFYFQHALNERTVIVISHRASVTEYTDTVIDLNRNQASKIA